MKEGDKPFFFTCRCMEKYIVRKEIEIQGSSQSVWRALTDPDYTKRYFFGCTVHSNWNEGDSIAFRRMVLWIFPFELKGKIIHINKGSLLQYSLKNSRSTSDSLVTIRLTGNNGNTIVSVTDDVGEGEGAYTRFNRSVKGWDKVLTGLKRTVENEFIR